MTPKILVSIVGFLLLSPGPYLHAAPTAPPADQVRHVHSLEEVNGLQGSDIESVVAHRLSEDALAALGKLKSVRSLQIEGGTLKGKKVWEALGSMASLSCLKLCEFEDKECTKTWDDEVDSFKSASLTELHLIRTYSVTTKWLSAFGKLPRLHTFYASSFDELPPDFAFLAGDWKELLQLRCDWGCLNFGKAFYASVSAMPKLQSLDLHSTALDPEAVKALVKSKSIKKLSLGWCTLGNDAAALLTFEGGLEQLALDADIGDKEVTNILNSNKPKDVRLGLGSCANGKFLADVDWGHTEELAILCSGEKPWNDGYWEALARSAGKLRFIYVHGAGICSEAALGAVAKCKPAAARLGNAANVSTKALSGLIDCREILHLHVDGLKQLTKKDVINAQTRFFEVRKGITDVSVRLEMGNDE